MTPKSRQFVILNTIETEGRPLNLRQLGALTGWDHTTLAIELGRLVSAGVLVCEGVGRTGPKQPAFEWRIA